RMMNCAVRTTQSPNPRPWKNPSSAQFFRIRRKSLIIPSKPPSSCSGAFVVLRQPLAWVCLDGGDQGMLTGRGDGSSDVDHLPRDGVADERTDPGPRVTDPTYV